MKLYVIRHGIAADAAGMADEARPLTDEGRQKFAQVVRGLDRLEVRLDRLIHSPLLRAVQTAELLAPILRGTTQVSANLAKSPSNELLAELRGEIVAVVGHEPWLSELVAWLALAERRFGHTFALKKGGIAVLEGSPKPGEMQLIGFHPPAVMREVGR